ncbi:site-specific integrase [Bacteroides gallinaceum]|uniref:tyrosine-type recombinase/integrase n=1 Tax=Bacteroides gallinaceum TaxID=1462571 RepID=UPI0025A38DA8|nr:site-specific integrase [Bacteroides gallinaceum]MDM8153994.1 site-specific integrase [Bacteroides gallinaceum]
MNSKQKDIQTAAIPLSIPERAGEGFGFITYANSRVEKLKDEGRYDAANKLKMYLRKFVTYLGKNEIPFKDFDALLIRNYHTWLKNQELGRNTISLYIRNLKRIYRLAVDEGIATESHPFKDMDVSYHIKKMKDRNRLTPEEVMRLRYMDTSGLRPSALFARDLFLFAVLTKGMTGRDMFYLTKSNLKDGVLTYTSKVNGKQETVRWNGFLQEIVDKYAQPDTPYLFPVITSEEPKEQWRQHNAAIHTINWNLRKIGKTFGLSFPLNLTVARHSWESLEK